MKKKPVTISTGDELTDQHLAISLFPDSKYPDIDVVRVEFITIEGTRQIIDMTPNEALTLSSLLNYAVDQWMCLSDEYKPMIKRINQIAKLRKTSPKE